MFLLHCDNKGCGKSQTPLLDKETNEVFCSECDKVIQNVTPFAKNCMRTLGQFKRSVKSQSSWAVKCQKCEKTEQPVLVGADLFCPGCKTVHTQLSPVYARSVKMFLQQKTK